LCDYRTAPIEEPLRAALALLEKFTLAPDEFSPDDIEDARRLGLSDAAIGDALYVSTVFNVIDRLADSFGFDIPSRASLQKSATNLLKHGYAFPPPVRWLSS
jgi:alkylhydroperoxidase family enzyme